MKSAKERALYDSYENIQDSWEAAKESLIDNGFYEDEITESDIWSEIYELDNQLWDDAEYELEKFFDNDNPSGYILTGYIGRWDGPAAGGFIFDSWDEFLKKHVWGNEACEDIRLYDVNGHFYIEVSGHDGRSRYEVKELTEKGRELYENNTYFWEKSEEEIHNTIMSYNLFSRLPHFAHKVFGCKKYDAA